MRFSIAFAIGFTTPYERRIPRNVPTSAAATFGDGLLSLAVIDAANPSALALLGRYREITGSPFEMYLRGDVAILMFSGWSQYEKGADGSYAYVSTSKVVALDVANPAAIKQLGSFDVPGSISDSRIVGNVLYVVGYEDGYCWRCEQAKPRSSIARPTNQSICTSTDCGSQAASWS